MKQIFMLLLTVTAFVANAQWIALSFQHDNLNEIFFRDSQHGYVSSFSENANPQLFTTTDGGMNWTEITLPEIGNNKKITSIHFADTQNGFLTTNALGINLKTTDGGQTWTVTDCGSQYPGKAYFKNDGTGFFWNYELFQTSDYGGSWSFLGIPDGGPMMHDLHFINDAGSIGFAIKDWGIFKTIDNGQTWSGISFGYEQSGMAYIHFLNENVGVVSDASLIYKTTDGGQNWSDISIQDIGGSKIQMITEDLIFCNPGQYSILKSLDGGATWQPTYIFGTQDPLTVAINFDFPDNNVGYAITESGNIYKIDVAASSEKFNADAVTIYPNPARDILNIDSTEQNTTYIITDVTGKTVLKGRFSNTIDVSGLTTGMYFLKTENYKTMRFIKE
ncbi:YCF48-related protein [Flavobacterium coralii]|uniref:T9SS type A sorting domain-containing protein n=1 Tax=Flavobacterium coralii TaxID=2838017 RepID=UPI000C5D3C2C|nr:hypothetical protein [Flavobacterium sp.]|tara:strand:- start:16 stop:1185 length:1170 start_codon:yes stop_codon:yes gene_type:complete